jgi:Trk K+ transport system NAD-binding subunit
MVLVLWIGWQVELEDHVKYLDHVDSVSQIIEPLHHFEDELADNLSFLLIKSFIELKESNYLLTIVAILTTKSPISSLFL